MAAQVRRRLAGFRRKYPWLYVLLIGLGGAVVIFYLGGMLLGPLLYPDDLDARLSFRAFVFIMAMCWFGWHMDPGDD